MKILYHHRTASRDGQEVHIAELVGALRGLGHPVRVVSPGGDEPKGGSTEMGGHQGGLARLRALLPDGLLPLAARAYELVFSRRVVRQALAHQADVLYERHALRNRVGLLAARKLRVPWLLEVNAPLAREQAASGRLKRFKLELARELEILRAADALLVVTEVLKQILVADGLAPERIHVIPNGVAPDRFLTPRTEQFREQLGLRDRLVLGFVGFPRPWHGLDRVVEVLAAADSGPLREAVLLIAGEGPALDPLLALARERGILDRIVVRGVLRREQMPAFIDSFDIALQPHATSYASPLKLFEYLARGVAVIAPKQPNLQEVLEHERSALLFDPDPPEAFGQALLRLADDDSLRAKVAAGGRQRVIEGGFTWTRNAERVVELARSLGAACQDSGPG